MKPVERILVATDFSPAGERAVKTAVQWAHREKAALRIVHVAPPKRWLGSFWGVDAATVHRVHQQASLALQRVADSIDPAHQLELSTGLLCGSASKEIARAAQEYNSDLIVIGARGEHETALRTETLGGTATKLIGSAPRPLLLVRTEPTQIPGSVLAAVDLSPLSGEITRWARLGAARSRLFVFHAYEVPFATRLETYGLAQGAIDIYTEAEHTARGQQLASVVQEVCGNCEWQQVLKRGNAASELLETIHQLNPDLLVIGKHGSARRRTGSGGSGNVCRYAVQFSPGNVLVVPSAPQSE